MRLVSDALEFCLKRRFVMIRLKRIACISISTAIFAFLAQASAAVHILTAQEMQRIFGTGDDEMCGWVHCTSETYCSHNLCTTPEQCPGYRQAQNDEQKCIASPGDCCVVDGDAMGGPNRLPCNCILNMCDEYPLQFCCWGNVQLYEGICRKRCHTE